MPKEKRRKGASSGTDQKKGGNSGFLAPIPLSDALVKFIGTGESALSRADVVKRMWDYIKQNNLQVVLVTTLGHKLGISRYIQM